MAELGVGLASRGRVSGREGGREKQEIAPVLADLSGWVKNVHK